MYDLFLAVNAEIVSKFNELELGDRFLRTVYLIEYKQLGPQTLAKNLFYLIVEYIRFYNRFELVNDNLEKEIEAAFKTNWQFESENNCELKIVVVNGVDLIFIPIEIYNQFLNRPHQTVIEVRHLLASFRNFSRLEILEYWEMANFLSYVRKVQVANFLTQEIYQHSRIST